MMEDTNGLFDDPEGYYPPTPPPQVTEHVMKSGKTITLHTVGSSALDAHHVWNGSRVLSDYFETHLDEIRGRTSLELGAGAGLASISAAILGARKVVMTDFPDADLIVNMKKNILGCEHIPGITPDSFSEDNTTERVIDVEGFVWGANPDHLLKRLQPGGHGEKFEVLILADLLFRHTEHGNLVKTVEETMSRKPESTAYVVFSSYRPWLQERDFGFFDVARERGFVVEKILEVKMDKVLFEEDPGDEDVLKTVTGWTLRWPAEKCT
ncbi:nicotinamide N-methyltransferase [Microdochium bolleyi]|uniref:Nicotinamide N-methyltransferase n=1 Tax=Microdochium bolleyi TaxID=196109 RepID=A0A136IXT3_9PEZI|nr:nicotinamide N-methyltransferase [Microdochium bolleyi]